MWLNLKLRILIIRYKLSNIIESYYKMIMGNNKELIKERLKICKKECDARHICPVCGCVLRAKAASKTNRCPINKW